MSSVEAVLTAPTNARFLDSGHSSQFWQQRDEQYPQINKSWRTHWTDLNTLFRYPVDIRKTIYTTNAIESLNNVIRNWRGALNRFTIELEERLADYV